MDSIIIPRIEPELIEIRHDTDPAIHHLTYIEFLQLRVNIRNFFKGKKERWEPSGYHFFEGTQKIEILANGMIKDNYKKFSKEIELLDLLTDWWS